MNEQLTALTLPDEKQFTTDIQAINRFQTIAHQHMKEGLDYGVIPGTQKPTLLKPGAEKIAKLLGLADQYEILDKGEDWDKGFFRYLIKCTLSGVANGLVVSEGLGECNSMESKYRWRWVFQSELPDILLGDARKDDRGKLVTRTINTRNGRVKQYRLANDDIYSQVNTIVKMAKKRALVDAALSAGRLSEVFTQDTEDIKVTNSDPAPKAKVEAKKTEKPAEDEVDTSHFANAGEFLTACAKPPLKKSRPEILEALSLQRIDEIKDFDAAYQNLLTKFGVK